MGILLVPILQGCFVKLSVSSTQKASVLGIIITTTATITIITIITIIIIIIIPIIITIIIIVTSSSFSVKTNG